MVIHKYFQQNSHCGSHKWFIAGEHHHLSEHTLKILECDKDVFLCWAVGLSYTVSTCCTVIDSIVS